MYGLLKGNLYGNHFCNIYVAQNGCSTHMAKRAATLDLQRCKIGGAPALDGLLKGRLVLGHLEEALLLLHIHLPSRPVGPLELRLVADKLGFVCFNLRPACLFAFKWKMSATLPVRMKV